MGNKEIQGSNFDTAMFHFLCFGFRYVIAEIIQAIKLTTSNKTEAFQSPQHTNKGPINHLKNSSPNNAHFGDDDHIRNVFKHCIA